MTWERSLVRSQRDALGPGNGRLAISGRNARVHCFDRKRVHPEHNRGLYVAVRFAFLTQRKSSLLTRERSMVRSHRNARAAGSQLYGESRVGEPVVWGIRRGGDWLCKPIGKGPTPLFSTKDPIEIEVPYSDPDKQREYQRLRTAAARRQWMRGKCCARCGGRNRLEVDHIDPTKKVSHRIWSWSRPRREAELMKCQVLCRDCHLRKTISQKRLQSNNTSGVAGVTWCRRGGNWKVRVEIDGKRHSVGRFDDLSLAEAAVKDFRNGFVAQTGQSPDS